jgi:hypothetical protein
MKRLHAVCTSKWYRAKGAHTWKNRRSVVISEGSTTHTCVATCVMMLSKCYKNAIRVFTVVSNYWCYDVSRVEEQEISGHL